MIKLHFMKLYHRCHCLVQVTTKADNSRYTDNISLMYHYIAETTP